MFLKYNYILRKMLCGRNNQTYQKIDSGYTKPCPMLNKDLPVFMLCLTYFYHIHQMIYCVAFYTCYLHHFTVHLLSPFLQSLGAPTDVQGRGQESSQKRQCQQYSPLTGHATIVCANHSWRVSRYWISYYKCHTSSISAVASFYHADLLGQLSPGDQR